MLLGDLGAEIIKVERPGAGDDVRAWGPPFVERNGGRESCYYLSINRNKKSVTLDFKNPKDLARLRKLADQSDVLLENFQPGTLSKYGLDYENLAPSNPGLIHCSITGFGQSGPDSRRGGYDVIAASIGGMMHITGPQEGAPCKSGTALTDLATGLYAKGAILTALLHRTKTGRGQKIDCNLLSTQVSLLVNIASNYINGGLEGKRWGSAHASIVPYESFKTKDGYLTIAAGNDVQFVEFCSAIGLGDLAKSEKYSTNPERVKNRHELIDILNSRLQERTNSDWDKVFREAGVRFPYGPVNKLAEVFSDPQVLHNGMLRQDLLHDSLGPISQVGPAVRFSSIKNEPRSAPPTLGQHNSEVLDMLKD